MRWRHRAVGGLLTLSLCSLFAHHSHCSYTKKDYLSPLLGKGEWAKITAQELETVYLYSLLKRGENDQGGRGGGRKRRRRGRRNVR